MMKRIEKFVVILLICAATIAPALGELAPVSRTPQWLKTTEAQIQSVVKAALPCTVALTPANPKKVFGTGSGVVITPEGLILTAAHVSMDMGEKVTVQFHDGTRAEAKVLGMDFGRDAGMLQIVNAGSKRYPHVALGNSSTLQINQWCIALGHSGGFQAERSAPVRLGRILANDREGFITTDSFLIGGDSGGPLLNLSGQLIGIHSNIGSDLNENNHVPIAAFHENWERLLAGKRFGNGFLPNKDRAEIGAFFKDTASSVKGAVIEKVIPGSPAEKSGLRPGDSILKLGDLEISSVADWKKAVNRLGAGDSADLTIRPDQQPASAKVVSITFESARKLKMPATEDSGVSETVPKRPEPSPLPPEKRAQLQSEFNEMMKKALEEERIEWSPATVDKFGGWKEMAGFLRQFSKTVPPEKLDKLFAAKKSDLRPSAIDPDQPQPVTEKFFRDVLNAFRPSNARASDAIHLVFLGEEWKSLCTVVHENGYALTKASEIAATEKSGPLQVLIAKGRLCPATVVKTFPDHDLALIKLNNAPPLVPAIFSKEETELPLGTVVSAPSSGPDSLGIGVVSVQPRSLSGKNKGFLGIRMSPHEKGVLINEVTPNGNAGTAGLRPGDVITSVGKIRCDSPEKLIQTISGTRPGAEVIIHFLRDGKEDKRAVTLRSRETIDADEDRHGGSQYRKMNSLGTEVSRKATGFLNVLQTDLPLEPRECGGVLVDLEGNVIGLTIARAGRICTYALPAKEVADLLSDYDFE